MSLAPTPAAPAPSPTAPVETNAVTYVCDDGSTVATFELERARDPRARDEEATWTLGRRAPIACQILG